MENTLQLSLEITMKSIELQIEAGAEVICVCEPAANTVYISPDTLQEASEDIFDRLIIEPNKKITQLIQKNDRQLIFHNCGELTDLMLKKICILNPQVLSLGSSRDLAKDASIVPDNIVLLGNLPSKEFFQKDRLSVDEVERLTCELQKNMIATKHPFILASECDVLSVKGSENIIQQKVDKMMNCNCQY
jgi:uroporphyrinogen-III decarboxylase